MSLSDLLSILFGTKEPVLVPVPVNDEKPQKG